MFACATFIRKQSFCEQLHSNLVKRKKIQTWGCGYCELFALVVRVRLVKLLWYRRARWRSSPFGFWTTGSAHQRQGNNFGSVPQRATGCRANNVPRTTEIKKNSKSVLGSPDLAILQYSKFSAYRHPKFLRLSQTSKCNNI